MAAERSVANDSDFEKGIMNTMVESFYKVIPFKFRYRKKCHSRYPEFKLMGDDALFFMTLDEAERYVQEMGQTNRSFKDEVDNCLLGVYAYVVIEFLWEWK